MRLDPTDLQRSDLNKLVNSLVYPRPIAWVSTIGADGTRNLAPFSFFNAFCFHPKPILGIGPGSRRGVNKDSLKNIKETGEFVVNTVSGDLAHAANRTAAEFGPDVDEWEVAGVTPVPSETVAPERVAESPAAFECRVRQIVELGSENAPSNSLVVAEVDLIHVLDEALFDGYHIHPEALDLVGRMGGPYWVKTGDYFELPRPASTDPDEVRADVATIRFESEREEKV